jgi:hypothetical protein
LADAPESIKASKKIVRTMRTMGFLQRWESSCAPAPILPHVDVTPPQRCLPFPWQWLQERSLQLAGLLLLDRTVFVAVVPDHGNQEEHADASQTIMINIE